MAKNWVSKTLSSLFGISADTRHWAAVSLLMEQSLGKIIIDVPIEGGKVRAFFENQTLIGDVVVAPNWQSKDRVYNPDMDEPIGFGRSRDEAVIDLWNKLISVPPEKTILRCDFSCVGVHEPFAIYKSFRFERGNFSGSVRCGSHPPDRHPLIQKYFKDQEAMGVKFTGFIAA